MTIRKRRKAPPPEPIAGNGLLDRRMLLGRGIMFAGATTTGVGALLTGAAAEPLKDDPWSEEIGAAVPSIQVPSRFEKNVVRTLSNPDRDFRTSHARTPARHALALPDGDAHAFCRVCRQQRTDVLQ